MPGSYGCKWLGREKIYDHDGKLVENNEWCIFFEMGIDDICCDGCGNYEEDDDEQPI